MVTAPTDTGNGGFTHPFFRTPRSAADLYKDRDAIAEWARMTYGWMGRSPDYKAAFLGTLGANSDFYAPFAGQRAPLVCRIAGEGPVLEPRDHQPAGGPGQAAG